MRQEPARTLWQQCVAVEDAGEAFFAEKEYEGFCIDAGYFFPARRQRRYGGRQFVAFFAGIREHARARYVV